MKLDQLTNSSSTESVAEAIVEEAVRRNYSREECIGVVSDGLQESELQLVWDHSHRWFGDYQQDASYPNRFTHAGNVRGFLNRLDVKRTSPGHGDIWLNVFWLQQRPSEPSAQLAFQNGRQAYLSEIQSKRDQATTLVDRFWPSVVITPPTPETYVPLIDPRTITRITNNGYKPRGMLSPMWIACHTSESMSRVLDLARYCEGAGVSYNRLVDDRDVLVALEDQDAPWAAMGANKYAYHVCWTSSFAAWSRGQWLDESAANDGIDERQALRNGAKVVAYWVQQSDVRDHRPIPAVWMGDASVPPWGRNGVCGHVDFGQWGGGHHDPGPNFPRDVLMNDVKALLTGTATGAPSSPSLPPIVAPGTDPSKYADWMLYQGNPRNDVDRVMRVQHRLKFAYANYAGHLEVDGDFGALTGAAVREFQRRSGLVSDGIVGPATAALLKP